MFSGFLVAFSLAPTKMIGQNTQSNINITQEVADLVDRKVEINKEVLLLSIILFSCITGIIPLPKTY